VNAISLKKHIAEHGHKEVWFTLPRADFSIPVVSCSASIAMNYTDERDGLKYDSPVLGCIAWPEQVHTNQGLQKVHGLTLKEFYQSAVDARDKRVFVQFQNDTVRKGGTWEINRFEIHEDWVELS